jgi:oligogalacturonide transport system permease protein
VKPRFSLRLREALYGYAFISLWLVGFAVFTLLALVETFRYSLHAVTVTATGIALSFVGWANYSRALFADPRFVELLIGYALETLLALPIVLVFSMIIALMLNVRFALRGLFRTVFFLPVIITSGPVIRELTAQGATAAPGLTDTPAVAAFLAGLPGALRGPTEYLLGSFILILWFSGVQILIYLASLQKVERSLYEAAAIDGASAWEAFWKITLPALSGATLINAVFTVIILSHFSENRVVRYIFERTYDAAGGIGYASATAFLYFGAMALLLVAVYLVLGRGASER